MNLLDLKSRVSTCEFSRQLRERGPLFWSEAEQIWVITDYRLAVSCLRGSHLSADRMAFFTGNSPPAPHFFSLVKKMMVNSDPPEHTQRRRLAASGLADHVLDHFQPRVVEAIGELLKGRIASGARVEFDFVADLALPLPNRVLADLFSIPESRRLDFYRWANDMTQFFGGAADGAEAANRGAQELREYFSELIVERREDPADDFISHLLRNQGTMVDDEVIAQAAIMLVAGTITTTDQLANNLFQLLEMWPTLVDRPDLLELAIEEATRLDPAVNFVFRVATSDFQGIQAGQPVFVALQACNRDPAVFAEPNQFRLDRKPNPHLSYGSGAHYCIGSRLGRIQMRELYHALLTEFPRLQMVDYRRKHQSLGFSGFETLKLAHV